MCGEAALPLLPPMPKIMICGQKGSGVTTQIQMLCDKYRLESFDLLKEFLSKLNSEKAKRKRLRLLNRGFKPLPEVEEGEDAPVDEELEEEEEGFDREAHDRDIMKTIFDASRG